MSPCYNSSVESFLINAPALWFLFLNVVILVLYLLRLKRRRHEVSSILLFTRSVEEMQANAPLQWLKKNLLLLLQLLVLILLVLSLTRPFISMQGVRSGKTVILIDTSYSMMARGSGGTRLERASEEVRKVIANLRSSDMAMIVAMTTKPHVLNGFTPDRMELQRSINRIDQYLGGTANIDEAMKLVSPLMKEGAHVVLISDGGFTHEIEDSIPHQGVFDFVSVGEEIDNIGITSLAITEIPGTNAYELFYVITNFTNKAVWRTMKLSSRDTLLDQRKLGIEPETSVEVVISPLERYSSVLKLEFVEKDDFQVDDACDIVMPDERIIPVNFVSEPDVLFESALAGDESLDVVRIPPSGVTATNLSSRNGVYIFNKCMPPNGVRLPMLVVAPSAPLVGVTPGETTEGPLVVDWDESHPMLAFIRVTDLRIAVAIKARITSDIRTVIDGTDGPLLVAGEDMHTRFAVLLFDVAQSDFPLRAAFPIFLHNTAVWLSRTASGFDPFNTSVGRPWKCKVGESVERVELISPSGRKSLLAVRGNEVGGVTLDEIGVWYVDNQTDKKPISVNLLDSEESRVNVADSFRVGDVEFKSDRRAILNREIYPWVIIFVLFVILGEWFVYHQRNV